MFLKWSHSYPLSIDDVKLRNKNWVELLPKGPSNEDLNAIESDFYTFKGKSKTRHFSANKVLDLYLGIGYTLRSEIESHIEEQSTNSVLVSYQVFLASTKPS